MCLYIRLFTTIIHTPSALGIAQLFKMLGDYNKKSNNRFDDDDDMTHKSSTKGSEFFKRKPE